MSKEKLTCDCLEIERTTISDACIIQTGKLDANAAITNGEYPFFTCASVPERIDTYAFDEDVVLVAGNNARGNFHVSRYKGKFNAYQRTYILTAKEDYDIDFIFYTLKIEMKHLKEKSQGSQTKFLTKPLLENIILPSHSKANQRKIASVLSNIDNKININNKIIAELETMAKMLYEYWFVQFDFPNEAGKPYKSSGGKMVYNDELKREIPEGWEVKKLSSFIVCDKSGDWGKEFKTGNHTLKVTCIRGTDINGLNKVEKFNPPTRFIHLKNQNKILSENDLVVEISGGSSVQSTGRLAYITNNVLKRFTTPLICSNFCKIISLTDNNYFYTFIFLWKSLYANDTFFGWEGKTSGIKNLLFDNFVNQFSTCIPPSKVAKEFNNIISPIDAQKNSLLMQNQELQNLRDWLLPMLMNGQARVMD